MRSFSRKFRYGEKGFTLIELLVVVAILGVLAAVAVPNIGRFIGEGQEQAASTELHNVQTAVMAGMAEAGTGNITGGDFGNTGMADPPTGTDLDIDATANISVGDYFIGGAAEVQGDYDVSTEGVATQAWYPGD